MGQISPEHVRAVRERELARFAELRPRGMRMVDEARACMPNGVPMAWMLNIYEHPPIVVERGRGAHFTDVDGNDYLDFNLADTSMFGGHGAEPVVRAVADRVAAGSQFLLTTEDAAWVATELGRRFGLPYWQFTLSATQANTEALRVARAITGREIVLMFDGKYHGHAGELLGRLEEGGVGSEGGGFAADTLRHVRIVPYNDLDAVARELARDDVACVLAEAAITNTGVIMPADGFHVGLRLAATETGTLLVVDETHTLAAGPGGLTRHWSLDPDIVVMGKSIANGIPLAAYGMTAAVAQSLEQEAADAWTDAVATGGTLFANALSLAAARATLSEVLTDETYARAAALGAALADGIEAAAARHDLSWRAHRLFNRSGYTHAPDLPANASQARATFDLELYNTQRLWMANRGVWEAIDSAGPACGATTTEADVDRYLEVLDDFLGALA